MSPIIRGPKPVMRPVRPVQKKPVAKPEDVKKEDVKSEVKSTPEVQPAVENKPTLENKIEEPKVVAPVPTVESKPVAETKPVVESKPLAETKVEQKTPASKQAATKPQKPQKVKSESKGGGGLTVLLTITTLLFMGSTGYLLFDKFQTAEVVAQEKETTAATYKADVSSKLAEINRLEDSLKVVIRQKESLGLELTEERAKLAELEDLKVQIQKKNYSINALNKKLASIKENYAMAASTVEAMNASNSVVIKEREMLREQLKAKDDSLQFIINKALELQEKVEIASALRMQSINVAVFNTAGKELSKSDSYKAMVVGKMKINVVFEKNEIAEGKKDIYIRVLEPGGAVLREGDKNFMVNGKKTPYTEKVTIDAASQHTASVLYVKGSRYRPGAYTVEVYSEGKKAGSEVVNMRQ